ncbi:MULTISPECIES: hypothetical protein [unclassified Lentimonas]|uniref:hypothetical protein n=1 Tax=unclassified Lentimonas TaxID=2630993 RepID=UPI001327CAA8|nr:MULTISPECIES: hypothetical protein [unclassified Lentimonas]CAA6677532.1 Unannotated [Lentimonas sp. CC4]CAA6684371.1 Unannotated [Lentimonas sp. CC6]CAA7078109.1 Unannotated [Lentimonas sp. CC4]CAA7172075.1 Unannotated [Lentimonas sp. CC21]CAA7183131.1 Unannotated [Lentimonas sp. CC8]
MKKLILIFFLPSLLMAMLAFTPMPEKPDFTRAADFVQEVYDNGHAFPKELLTKEKFTAALIQGTFDSSNPSIAYRNKDYPYDSSMARFNGVITLNDGTLYTWMINRKGRKKGSCHYLCG